MKIKRLHMTLLEVLISLSLLSILLTALMGFYHQMEMIQRKVSESRQDNFKALYLHYRLSQVIPKIVGKEAIGKVIDTCLYLSTKGPIHPNTESLIFVYDNGVDGNPLFSNHVIGKLFINPEENLCLATWPSLLEYSEANPPMRLEVLFEKVQNISFNFYIPPFKASNETSSIPSDLEKYGSWQGASWSLDERKLPAMMEITLYPKPNPHKEHALLTYRFLLINSNHPLIYQE